MKYLGKEHANAFMGELHLSIIVSCKHYMPLKLVFPITRPTTLCMHMEIETKGVIISHFVILYTNNFENPNISILETTTKPYTSLYPLMKCIHITSIPLELRNKMSKGIKGGYIMEREELQFCCVFFNHILRGLWNLREGKENLCFLSGLERILEFLLVFLIKSIFLSIEKLFHTNLNSNIWD